MKIKSLLMVISIATVYLIAVSFQSASPLQGVWEYQGGKYNKQVVTASKEVKLTKVYTASDYQLVATNKSGKVVNNEKGTYSVKNNILVETRTSRSTTPSLKSTIMPYTYIIQNDKLTIKGKLTNKWPVEEYWKKVK